MYNILLTCPPMIKQISKLFNKKLMDKDKHYNKIINELVESNRQKESQIQILCETIKILNAKKKQQPEIPNKIEQIVISNKIEQKEKTDKYQKPINNFGEIKPILKSLDLRNMINRITQDSIRISVNNETKNEIIGFGFESRHEYLYFKINLNVKNRIVLKKSN